MVIGIQEATMSIVPPPGSAHPVVPGVPATGTRHVRSGPWR
ncbi:hypothetical protein ACSNN9_25150 [Micromonospora sp. URMC 107]